MKKRIYNGDTFERGGYQFRVRIDRDEYMAEPWKECDGHGPVSGWRPKDSKRPGERILHVDRSSCLFYDWREAMRIARRDDWGCQHSTAENMNGPHTTAGERIQCAVERDFQHLRAWCRDEWEWQWIQVVLLDYPGDVSESLGGIEDPDGTYALEVAEELADEILARVEVNDPDVVLSEN